MSYDHANKIGNAGDLVKHAVLAHILATLGLRYLRLDQVDLSMATVVCAMPLILPLVYFMMKRLSR